MKLLFNYALLVSLLTCLPFKSIAQRIVVGPEASDLFSNAELVRTSVFSELPSYIQFREGQQFDIDDLEKWMISNFKFAPSIGFIQIRKEKDNLGHTHYRYQQTLNGTPIEDAIWIAHTKLDKVYSLNGLIYTKIITPTTASLSEESALEKAMIHVGASIYKWQIPAEEEHLKWESGDQTATYYPTAEMVFVCPNYTFNANAFRLVYKFNIYAHSPMSRADIYVDANSGEVIREIEIIHHADEPGVAHTGYSGERDIIADSFDGEYRLRDASRGDGIRTFDMNQGTSYGSSVDFIDDDNDWDNANPQLDEYATDAHWGSEMTYDYYLEKHDRNSIDNDGFQLNSYVHYGVSYFNAFWDGSRMTYGDGSSNPLTTLDIAGHEVTHGLTSLTAGLIYYAESGALNESFSDIFGNAIERYARPDEWDWLLGEELGSAFRNMANPNAKGDPDTYFGDYWASLGGGDSGGVHTNSGVQNFWFYLLTEGGTGTNDNGDAYDVTALGIDDASAIAYRNLTVYLTSSSQYADARFYSIKAAEDIFGTCTIEMEETANAWYAVGVGGVYDPTTIADFSSLDILGCSLPFEVNFTNESYNASTFEWDFGDGTTSTEENPTHIYTEAGTYTVTLSVDGGACGSDEITYVDFLTINPDLDCIIILPPSGTLGIQSSCIGTLFDSGGEAGNYGGGENAQVTISPLGALTVDLAFPFFDVEPGTGASCNYDYVEIYDGPDIYAPLIDRYCNNNIPSDLTSSGNSITIFFHSDGGLELPGFQIDWMCNPPENVPDTDFSVNTEESCNGLVFFTDLSTNIPILWLWDFGDGETSTEQHPLHTYSTSGTYTVSLTATNLTGDSTTVKTDYITVTYPENPVVEGDTNCTEQIATLTAIADGTLRWYDVPTGGSPIFIGDVFTTPVLDLTTIYYVETDLFDAPLFVGPVDNTFGGGDYFNGDQHLVFNNPNTVILESVDVFANGAGIRTIELRDNTGAVLQTMDVELPDGASTVTLDMILPVGTSLQLGVALGSSPDLYRNDSGAPAYPFALAESVEIIGTSAGPDNYYFFYNWEVHPYTCVSERIEVVAEVLYDSDITIDAVDDICLEDTLIMMNATTEGGTWSASCDDCIDAVTGAFDPTSAGLGTWEITYTVPGTCSYLNTLTVNVVESDINITPVEDICLLAAPVIITASEEGGVWSAECDDCIDAVTGEFNPTTAGLGSWEITYTVPGTCSYLNTIVVNVIESDINIAPVTDICSQGASVIVTASESGGVWSASCDDCIDAVTGEFDPALAGIGSWTITYTVDGTCSQYNTATINVIDCLGLPTEKLNQITIYPNPSNGLIFINTGLVNQGEIIIKDVLGKKIAIRYFNSAIFTVDMTGYNARGTYFIEFYDQKSNLISIKKIVCL